MRKQPYMTLVRHDIPTQASGDFVTGRTEHDVAHRQVIERRETRSRLERIERYAQDAQDCLTKSERDYPKAWRLLREIERTLHEELNGTGFLG